MTARPLRIATIYSAEVFDDFKPSRMSILRWLRMSESLARAGHQVDMIINTPQGVVQRRDRLRFVPTSEVCWEDYDVLKLSCQRGFDTVRSQGAADHPCLVSRLANVVGDGDHTRGVHYTGVERAILWELQEQIRAKARLVVVGTEDEKKLWHDHFGPDPEVVVIPTGVDRTIPRPRENPYAECPEKIAVYVGNLRARRGEYRVGRKRVSLLGEQATNDLLQDRLNRLGRLLKEKNIRLCAVGPGRATHLDPTAVTYLGFVDCESIWDYQYFADVGIALAFGPDQLYESSKIYYYLRGGLPVVSEASIANNFLIRETGMGLVSDFGDDRMMSEMIEAAVHRSWNTEATVRYLLRAHTWDHRAACYDRFLSAL